MISPVEGAACWELGPAMEVNSCPRSVVCMGLGGLGSSTRPVRKGGVDLGHEALLRTRGNHLPSAPLLWVGHSFRGRGFLQPSRREGPVLSPNSQDMPSGSGLRPGPAAGLAQGAQARNGSGGGRAQEALGPRQHSSHLLLLQPGRYAPLPAPALAFTPRPASAGRRYPGGYEGGGQMPAARLRRRYSVRVDPEEEGRSVPGRFSHVACFFQF